MAKLKIALYWAASCGGCEIATLAIHEKILKLAEVADIVFWPVGLDFKYADVEKMADKSVDVCLFNGAIRNEENEHMAKLLRAKSKIMIAYGSCAYEGCIPGLSNFYNRQLTFDRVYIETPSTENPKRIFPQTKFKVPEGFSRDRMVHEELVQDVFVEAYMSLRSYRGKAPFEHWLSRIATRVGYRYWKQMARRRETESFTMEEWDQVADRPAEQMDPSEAASLIHRLLAQLAPRDRLVLTLRYLEGCDVAETARRTGWTRGMVKVQALRAKKKLEKLIAKAGKGLE